MISSQLTRLVVSSLSGYLAICFLTLSLITFGLIQWPGLHLDAAFFAPIVLNVANGRGWTYDSFPFFMVFHGDQNYDFHGILHVIVYGILLGASRWTSLFLWLALVNSITFLIYFFLYLRVLCRNGVSSTLLAALFAVVPAVLCLGLQGRPEQLAPLLIALPFLLLEVGFGERVFLFVLPVIGALLILLSPLPGAIYCASLLLALTIHSLRQPFSPEHLKSLGLGILCGIVLTFAIFEIFTPFDLARWLHRTGAGGSTAFTGLRYLFNVATYKWGFTLIAPLWNTFLLLFFGVCLAALVARRHLFRPLHILALVVFALVFSKVLPVALDYTLVPFIPAAALVLLDRKGHGWLFDAPWLSRRIVQWPLALFAILYAYVFVQLAVLAGSRMAAGDSLSATRARLHQLISANGNLPSPSGKPAVVAVNSLSQPSFIVLGGENLAVTALGPASFSPNKDSLAQRYEAMFNREIRFYVTEQKFPFLSGDIPKVVWLGQQPFDLVGHHWSSQYSLLERLVRPRQIAGDYRFALYRRRE